MKKILSVIDAISIWSGKVAGWLVLLVIGFIIYEILMRYLFHLPTLWVSESMVFGSGLTYLLGGALIAFVMKDNNFALPIVGKVSAWHLTLVDFVHDSFMSI